VLLDRARLPLRVDGGGLRADVEGLAPQDWVPHFNSAGYEGDWSGAALRSVGGAAGRLYPDPAASTAFADTPLLARCPHTAAMLDALRCPLLAARFLRLGPGSQIKPHTDLDLGFEDGEVRLHVPVSSGAGVEFLLDGRPVEMVEGEIWYLDLNLRHSVVNRGTTPRVHLVVDCVVDGWLDGLLGPCLGVGGGDGLGLR
jgi:hypothetical protein